MRLFFNILFGWTAIISGILLSIIWFIRIMQKKMPKGKNKDFAIKINKFLRKNHIKLGYVFIISVFVHGRLSSFSIFSFNYGTLAFIIGIAICYTYIDKAKLGKKWIKYHRELTLFIMILTLVHIIEVGGFVGINRVLDSIKADFKVEEQVNQDSEIVYADGVYEGIGNGYRPGLRVEVTVQNGFIQEVLIREHNEVGKKFYLPAFDIILR